MTETAEATTPAAPAAPAEPMVMVGDKAMPRAQLETNARRSANWFFWVAALSVLNTVMIVAMKSETVMVLGLGITIVMDAVAAEALAQGGVSLMAAIPLALNVIAIGVFALLGWQARKLKAWPFYLGFALYALDSVLFIMAGDWIGIGIHAFVLFVLFTGMATVQTLRKAPPAAAAAVEPAGA